MPRIALICENDESFALENWVKTIPHLRSNGYILSGIWLVNKRLGKYKGKHILKYYLQTFGLLNFFLLTLLSARFFLKRVLNCCKGNPYSFRSLANSYNIPLFKTNSPNDPECIGWMKQNDIEILIIMVGFVIHEPLINSVKLATVNKHAALLPSFRGLFPFIWAYIKGREQGITIHKVTTTVDSGPIIVQEIVPSEFTSSMMCFYKYVFKKYPDMLLRALKKMNANEVMGPKYPSSYYSLPTRADYQKFERTGGKIIKFRDLL